MQFEPYYGAESITPTQDDGTAAQQTPIVAGGTSRHQSHNPRANSGDSIICRKKEKMWLRDEMPCQNGVPIRSLSSSILILRPQSSWRQQHSRTEAGAIRWAREDHVAMEEMMISSSR